MNDLISRSLLMDYAKNHIGGVIDCNDIARFPVVEDTVQCDKLVNENAELLLAVKKLTSEKEMLKECIVKLTMEKLGVC